MAVCDASMTLGDYLANFEFIKGFVCVYANVVGMLTLGLLVYGAISVSIYARTNSLIIPFVLLLLTGGAVMTQVASVASGFATIVLLMTFPGLAALLYYYYSR